MLLFIIRVLVMLNTCHHCSLGNLYIAEPTYNHRIRKVAVSTDVITTIAGSGGTGVFDGSYSGDGGAATSARLNNPHGVAVDTSGNCK